MSGFGEIPRQRMWKPARLGKVTSLVLVCLVAGGAAVLAYPHVFASPAGELIGTAVSPNGRLVVQTYYVSFNAGATGASSSGLWRVEVRPTNSGSTETHTIYYDYVPVSNPYVADAKWVGNDVVVIASHRYDVRTASASLSRPYSEFGYYVRWVELIGVVVCVLVVGLAAVFLAWRRVLRSVSSSSILGR